MDRMAQDRENVYSERGLAIGDLVKRKLEGQSKLHPRMVPSSSTTLLTETHISYALGTAISL
jgi:hypothetical protein